MSNPFAINIVTADGASLIAQATAANQIVITSALSGTTAATDAADLASKTTSFYDGITGSIASCSATGNIAKIVSKFGNAGANPQAVKSVCILGRLASQSAGSEIIIAAMSDADSEIVLPSDSSPSQITRFPFNFQVSSGDTVETVYSDGATIADLDRFVSTHKAGDPTDGDNQTILGDKTFEDYVTFQQPTTFQNGVYITGSLETGGTITADGGLVVGTDAQNPANVTVYGTIDGILTTSSSVGDLSTEYGMVGIKYSNVLRANLSFAGLYLYDSTGTLNLKLDSTNGSAEIGSLTVSGSTVARNVSVTGLTGTAPHKSSGTLIIPVGCIVCAVPDSFVSSYSVGDSISISASTFKACDLSGSTKTDYITAGSYKAVSNTDSNGVTLLQRIS